MLTLIFARSVEIVISVEAGKQESFSKYRKILMTYKEIIARNLPADENWKNIASFLSIGTMLAILSTLFN